MTVSNLLQRKSILAAGLVLLAGASGLLGQTTANQFIVPTTSMAFTWQTGTATPSPQTIRIYSSPVGATYTASVATANGLSWLTIGCSGSNCGTTPTGGAITLTGNTGTSGQDLAVTVNPSILSASGAPYTGTVTLSSGSTTQVINVSLTVTNTPTITITPSSIPVQLVEANRSTSIQVTVNSTSGANGLVAWQATIDQTPATGWLALTTVQAATGSSTLLTINAAQITNTNLAVGTVRFTQLNTNPVQTVTLPISVQITPGAQLQQSFNLFTFPYQLNQQVPGPKPISVTSSTSTQLTYSVAPAPGQTNYFNLSLTPSTSSLTSLTGLQTPTTFYVVPNIGALPQNAAPGNYDTVFQVTSPPANTQTFTARIVVTNLPTLTTSADYVNYGYTLGGTDLQPTTINVGSTSSTIGYTVIPAYDNGVAEFFRIINPTPFSGFSLQIAPDMNVIKNLVAGTYTGRVRLVPGNGSTPIAIEVTLNVTGSQQISVNNAQPVFTGALNATVDPQSVTVYSSTANPVSFTAAVNFDPNGPKNWLIMRDPNNTAVTQFNGITGTASAVIGLTVNPTAVTSAGTYTASLVITPIGVANAVPFTVPVKYTVTGTTAISVDPVRIDLTQTGTTPPQVPPIQVNAGTGVGNVTYTAVPSAAPGTADVFVAVASTSVLTLPGTLQLTLNSANLAPRTEPYVNNVTIIPSSSNFAPIVVPISVTVRAQANLQVTPASLAYSFTSGNANPGSQTINVTSSGAAIAFSVSATSQQGSWLSINPPSGTTNATGGAAIPITVSVNPAGLNAGTYTGTIAITPTIAGGQPVNVPVTLTVTTPNPPNSLQVSNNASGISRGVSPGQFITIKGRNMAPGAPIVFSTVPAPTTLGEVRVLFDGVPAPVLYVGPSGDRTTDQINAIVPYGVSGRASTNMVVEFRSVASAPVPLTVRDTEPGLFTANSAGFGPASLLNQDNSYNTQTNPAVSGSVVQIYGTGEGLIAPNPGEGRVVPATAPFPSLLNGPVQVRIGGRVANVVYAGPAPGLLAGVFQINAVVPTDLAVTTATSTSLDVQIGNTSSQPGVTFWVRGQQ